MKKIILFISAIALFSTLSAQVRNTYTFDNPQFQNDSDYAVVTVKGCQNLARVGEPVLPYQAVALLLPEGQKAVRINVELSDFVDVPLDNKLSPYQPARRYSDQERTNFYKNEEVYKSEIYPLQNVGKLTTAYKNGYAIALSSFTPFRYNPLQNKLQMAQTAIVSIETENGSYDYLPMLKTDSANIDEIKAMVDNPKAVDSYLSRGVSQPNYDLLIITGEDFIEPIKTHEWWQFNSKRLVSKIVDIQDIYSSTSGVDRQDKIRNFIKQEYVENGISMVILGGDVEIVPYRGFYCQVLSGGEYKIDYDMPADLYYAALDGTWYDEESGLYGLPATEDLYPEIAISRLPFKNLNQLNNVLNKSLNYQKNPVESELENVLMAGEFLYDNPYTLGSDYLELLIGERSDNGYTTQGFPASRNIDRYYYENEGFSGYEMINRISSGTNFVNHVGHANVYYVAGWSSDVINTSYFNEVNGIDHNFIIFHTHGCDCGAFDQDCILEKMVTEPILAAVTIGNSRYGWFNEGTTEGPAEHLHRETVSAYSAGDPFISVAVKTAKCKTAPWVNAEFQFEEGALRWNFYELTVFGDGALRPWFSKPIQPEIICEKTISKLKVTLEVTVVNSTDIQPLSNVRINLFNGQNRIAFGVTNEEGKVTLEFDPLGEACELTLSTVGISLRESEVKINVYDGLEEENMGNICTISPNPSDGNVVLSLPESGCDVIIYNSLGQIVKDFHALKNDVSMNLSLNPGNYFVQIKDNDGVAKVERLIIY